MMKKIAQRLIGVSCLLLASHAFATIEVDHWQTKQGVDVYFIPSPAVPIVDIALQFQAGSFYDGHALGLATLTNGLFGEGTKQLSSEQITDQFASTGALFSNNTDEDFSTLQLRSLTQPIYLQPALSLFKSVVSQLQFDDSALARVKNQMKVLVQQQNQQPDALANQIFLKNLYGPSAYAEPVFGTLTSISQITLQQIMDFYHHYYTTSNMRILMVGAISIQQAHVIADHLASDLPKGTPIAPPSSNITLQKSATLKVNFPTSQSYVVMGHFVNAMGSDDRFAVLLANYILGQANLTSLLFKAVREDHGLSYNVNSQILPHFGAQPFFITLQSKNDTVNQAIAVAQKTLNNFAQLGVTDKQLTNAKRELINLYPLALDSNDKLLTRLSFIVGYHLPIDSFNQTPKLIEQVTSSQVQAALKKYFANAPLLTVIVGGQS